MKRKRNRTCRQWLRTPEEGFTLVEIMIVVAIIGVLVVIWIPNFMRVRMDTNEGMVRADIRAFSTANESYRAFQNPPVYAPSIEILLNQSYIDATWLNPGNKHGYVFVYAVGDDGLSYAIEANPLDAGKTGVNSYCVDQTGVLVRGTAPGLATTGGCVGGTPLGT